MRREDVWWKRLSDPMHLIDDVVSILLDNRSVVVVFDDSFPWKESFQDTLAQEIEMYQSEMRIKYHTVSAEQDPGTFLLQKYCSSELQRVYWPTDSKAKFLAEHPQSTLHKSYVFVDLEGSSDQWLRFIKEYVSFRKADDTHGLFVLLTNDRKYLDAQKNAEEGTVTTDAPIRFLDYTAYVHDYDTYLLCMTLLSQTGLSMQQQQYLAEIAVVLSGGSVMLAGALADRGEELAIKTAMTLRETAEETGISVNSDAAAVRQALWQAQLKVVFPLLEQFRCDLLKAYRSEINYRFNAAPAGVYDCETPDELEIGQLKFLFKNTRILSMEDYNSLEVARNARNCLAHLNYLPYTDMKALLHLQVHGKD